MSNTIILEGNLGRDPAIEMTQDGRQIARFSVATSVKWKDQAGEWHKRTDWHKISVYREATARWLDGILKKGTRVRITGHLTFRRQTDRYGRIYRVPWIVVSREDEGIELDFPKNAEEESLEKAKQSKIEAISQYPNDEENSYAVPHEYFQQLQQQTGEKTNEKL